MPATEADVFLNLLYSWQDKNWKCVSWKFTPPNETEPRWCNYGAQDIDSVKRLIGSKINGNDLYMAVASFKMADTTKISQGGFNKIPRKRDNAATFNAICMDIDVKPGAYSTTHEAKLAVQNFCNATGLPLPTMMVESGSGGLHVYWVVDAPMPAQVWWPLALALKDAATTHGIVFDQACTTDFARVLRVPGSFNHKATGAPPTQVRLVRDLKAVSFKRYPKAVLDAVLSPYLGMAAAQTAGSGATSYASNFTANVGSTAPPVSIDEVAAVCPATKEALDNAGAQHPEPLWNLFVLLASFTTDPDDAAHRMSRGYTGYSTVETDRKLGDKQQARASSPNLGPPTCLQVSGYHTACKTCPLFRAPGQQGYNPKQSPINLVKPAPKPLPADDLLPAPFYRDQQLHIWWQQTDPETMMVNHIEIVALPVHDAGIDDEGKTLALKVDLGSGPEWRQGAIAASTSGAAVNSFNSMGIWWRATSDKGVRALLLSWMGHLQRTRRIYKPTTFGWDDDGGFTFNKFTYKGLDESPAQTAKLDPRFHAKGELKPWQDAMGLIYGNVPLETVVATSFAAPLVKFICQPSPVVSVFSPHSGVGKTTALQIAQAVWGMPIKGMSMLNDSYRSTELKIADLNSLPTYWDEIRSVDKLKELIDLVFSVTGGKGRSTLTKERTQRIGADFHTMFCAASNYAVKELVYDGTAGTDAGGLRIFEMEIPKWQATAFTTSGSQALLLELASNYGVTGAAYAKFLAANYGKLKQVTAHIGKQLQRRLNFDTTERFWEFASTAILCGAHVANRAGLTRFDTKGIEDFLVATVTRMRAEHAMQATTTMTAPQAGQNVLHEMINDFRGRHLLVTDIIAPSTRGPSPVKPEVKYPRDPNLLQDVWAQAGEQDGKVMVRRRQFGEYLRKRSLSPQQVLNALMHDYTIAYVRAQLGKGCDQLDELAIVAGGRSDVYLFEPIISPYSTAGSSTAAPP